MIIILTGLPTRGGRRRCVEHLRDWEAEQLVTLPIKACEEIPWFYTIPVRRREMFYSVWKR